MTDSFFIDTNILVYSRDSSEPEKQKKASALLEKLWQNNSGRISIQVCNEYYVTVTQKLDPGLDREEAWDDIVLLSSWKPAPLDFKTIQKAKQVQSEYNLSWWDSLIISAAWLLNCRGIYSEDLNHGQKYLDMEIINPFI